MNQGNSIAVIVGISLLIGCILLLVGCSTSAIERTLNTGCDLSCKSCGEIKLKCNQKLDVDFDNEANMTVNQSIGK